ncbi:MAG: hypothetical protein O2783_07380, partial [Chloroflexi bacterium]|nr:hypothetical protein [Chloroflexota bacterium]
FMLTPPSYYPTPILVSIFSILPQKEILREQIDFLRESEIIETTEIWIGKSDYLLSQITSVQDRKAVGYVEFGFPNVEIPEGARFTTTVIYKFSDFKEPVEIETPTDVKP